MSFLLSLSGKGGPSIIRAPPSQAGSTVALSFWQGRSDLRACPGFHSPFQPRVSSSALLSLEGGSTPPAAGGITSLANCRPCYPAHFGSHFLVGARSEGHYDSNPCTDNLLLCSPGPHRSNYPNRQTNEDPNHRVGTFCFFLRCLTMAPYFSFRSANWCYFWRPAYKCWSRLLLSHH